MINSNCIKQRFIDLPIALFWVAVKSRAVPHGTKEGKKDSKESVSQSISAVNNSNVHEVRKKS